MPIHDENETITAGPAALEYFTDRHRACRCFAEYFNEDPLRERILFFHGDGGNGKSLLLKFLRERYCKRIDATRWAAAKAAEDAEFATFFDPGEPAEPVPSALLDFAPLPGGDESHHQAFAGLLKLRRALTGHGLHFPLFDFACLLRLQHTEGLSKDRLRTLFPPEEIDLIAALMDAVLTAAGSTTVGALGKAVLGVFNKYLGVKPNEWFTLWKQQRGLDEDQVEALRRMDPDRELVDEMPKLFAKDLNAAMSMEGAPKRVVLFFDTHEAFWGDRDKRELVGDRFFERDEWLRRLLGRLALEKGIVAVVAGREPPRWAEANKATRITDKYLDLQPVDSLSDAHAREYLERAGVADAALRECLVEYARVGVNQIHPLYLGLCVDIVRAANARDKTLTPEAFRSEEQVEDKGQELIHRLLSYVDAKTDSAIRALSAARAFNRDIYVALGKALDFEATRDTFGVLKRFSFIWEAKSRGQDWYRIHDLLRRLFAERPEDSDLLRDAHVALEQYYLHRVRAGDGAAIAEAIYHANRLDWERGVTNWLEVFDKALELSGYELCGVLLEVQNELHIDSSFQHGMVSQAEGEYFASLARYNEARQEYEEAIEAYDAALDGAQDNVAAHNNKGAVLTQLGDLQASRSQYREAEANYERAFASYDAALQLAPDYVEAHNNKGIVLTQLGDLQARRSQYREAEASYEQAIASYVAALMYAPDQVTLHNHKGSVLRKLGDLQASRSQYREAEASYEQAIASYVAALMYAPDRIAVHNNKGNVLQRLGDLQAMQSWYQEAEESYRQAIIAYDAALQRAPDHVDAHNNKGLVLVSLGGLQSTRSQYPEAEASYEQAIASYDVALQWAPDDVEILNNKGNVLRQSGDLQARRSQYREAEANYEQAIASYDAALQWAPDHVDAHNNKGLVLVSLGGLQSTRSQYPEAEASYEQAIISYDAALQWAPDDAGILNNKGNVLVSLGELQSTRSQYPEAEASYEQAIASYDAALRYAPDHVKTYTNKGNVLASLGELQSTRSQYPEAEASYEQAIASHDAVLKYAPDLVEAHYNKGNVLGHLGDLQKLRSQHRGATASYEQAIASYDAALIHAPDLIAAHYNKGLVLGRLGVLQGQLNDIAQALRSLRAAVAEWSRSLEIAPGDQRVSELRDRVQALLDYLEMTPEQIFAGLPPSVRNAIESEDPTALQQAFDTLSPQEQQWVRMALLALQAQQAGNEDEGDSSDMAAVLENFEPLLQAIAAVAGDTAQRGEIEVVLADLDAKGWHLSEAVQRIWAGERDEAALTAGLDAQDTALVKRLLQIIGEGKS